jgi:hypothetical protein
MKHKTSEPFMLHVDQGAIQAHQPGLACILEYVEKGKEKDSLRNIVNGKIAKYLKLVFFLSTVN